jgi:hypothetical protein
MSLSAQINDPPGIARRLAHWCRDWGRRRRTLVELDCCGPAEVARIAHDIGVSSTDLCVLAGKWPDSTNLLLRRMGESRLDATEIVGVEPQVMRDLQRVCTFCASKRKCEHDLASYPSDSAWQNYCPNATTLKALVAERANSRKTKAA